jgi:hypothetical protein
MHYYVRLVDSSVEQAIAVVQHTNLSDLTAARMHDLLLYLVLH